MHHIMEGIYYTTISKKRLKGGCNNAFSPIFKPYTSKNQNQNHSTIEMSQCLKSKCAFFYIIANRLTNYFFPYLEQGFFSFGEVGGITMSKKGPCQIWLPTKTTNR